MLGVACVLLSSCVVSKKKFEIAEAGRLAALYSRDSLADLLGMSRTDYAILDELKNGLEADTALLKSSIRNYQQLLASGQNENQKQETKDQQPKNQDFFGPEPVINQHAEAHQSQSDDDPDAVTNQVVERIPVLADGEVIAGAEDHDESVDCQCYCNGQHPEIHFFDLIDDSAFFFDFV